MTETPTIGQLDVGAQDVKPRVLVEGPFEVDLPADDRECPPD